VWVDDDALHTPTDGLQSAFARRTRPATSATKSRSRRGEPRRAAQGFIRTRRRGDPWLPSDATVTIGNNVVATTDHAHGYLPI
jgi:hypothetical protein